MGIKFDCEKDVVRILNGDNKICDKLYSEMMAFLAALNNLGVVDGHILSDIGQNAMMKFFLNLKKGKFSGQSNLQTYLNAIAKNEFYYYFRQNEELLPIDDSFLIDNLVDDKLDDTDFTDIKWQVFKAEFEMLSAECQKLIRLLLDKVDKKTVAKRLKFETEAKARERLYRCKLRLIQRIKENELYEKYIRL